MVQGWVFFDPASDFTHDLPDGMLHVVVRYAFWPPYIDRYIEFNTVSRSLRLRSGAIRRFRGKRVSYTVHGPVFVKDNNDSEPGLTGSIPHASGSRYTRFGSTIV